jgi:hypothetical protein
MPGPADLGQRATPAGHSSPPSPGPWATSESQRRSLASQRCNDLGFEAASHRDVEMFLGSGASGSSAATDEAVRRYGQLDARRTAAALHLTC